MRVVLRDAVLPALREVGEEWERGELEVGLIAFGLVLRSHGWRILFLGADAPIATLERAIATTDPRLVVVASFDQALLDNEAAALRRAGRSARLVLSGPGASPELCTRLRIERLNGDLVAAAGAVVGSF